MTESDEGPDRTAVDRIRAAVMAALNDGAQSVDPLVRVCRACVELLPVDGAAISVMGGAEHRELLYASDEVISRIAAMQFTLGEGPGFEAFETGRAVLVPDLADASPTSWPIFTSEIADLPVGALFAFPLQSGAIHIGVMDMYRRGTGWFTSAELATALQVVDLAVVALLGMPVSGLDGEWLAALPRDREEVHQATGMLIAQLGVPAEQALARLRGYAFVTGRLVEDVARDIVSRRLQLADDVP